MRAKNAGTVWRGLARRFRGAGIETAGLDARLLLGHVLGLDGLQLAVKENLLVSDADIASLELLAKRRLGGEPVARIVGSKEFYGLEFGLNEATLVPRPETEMLVDLGIEFLEGRKRCAILDLGTGSGCILISLLVNLSGAGGIGIDLSEEALEQAGQNSVCHGVEARTDWRAGSWFAPLGDEKFDLVVSNPPYIASQEIEGLQTEVRKFDPRVALDGGRDGLAAYRAIIGGASRHLRSPGTLLLEIGHDQAEAVAALCLENRFEKPSVRKDLAGQPRVIVAQY